MFDLLVKSKIRQKILRLFITNARKEFYLSEVASAVQTTPGTAQRELRKLVTIDLIHFHKKGNLSFYALNPRHYLLKEISGIMRKTFGIEDEIKQALAKVEGIIFAFLFGSYVKSDFKSDSDIDLYIIGDTREDSLLKVLSPIEASIGREINFHRSSLLEFRANCESSFIKSVIKNNRLIIGDANEFKTLFG
jgi:predicted nucleotidyltransferase